MPTHFMTMWPISTWDLTPAYIIWQGFDNAYFVLSKYKDLHQTVAVNTVCEQLGPFQTANWIWCVYNQKAFWMKKTIFFSKNHFSYLLNCIAKLFCYRKEQGEYGLFLTGSKTQQDTCIISNKFLWGPKQIRCVKIESLQTRHNKIITYPLLLRNSTMPLIVFQACGAASGKSLSPSSGLLLKL